MSTGRVATAAAKFSAKAAFTEAAIAGAVALVLAFPIVGLKTVQGQYHLFIVTQYPEVLAIGGAIFLVRLLILLQAGRWRGVRLPAAAPALASAQKALGFAGIGFAVILPFFSSGYIIDLATSVLIYMMLAWGLNIVVGLAGLLDLGYVAFYGIGAYTVGLLSVDFGFGFWECLPLAGMTAAIFGIILGFPVLRLRGDYLAIVTMGFGEIIRVVLLNWTNVTGGPNGIDNIPRPTFFGLPMSRYAVGQTTFADFFHLAYSPAQRMIFLYFVILAMALATNLFALRLRRLPIGRAWEALREDEIACRAVGINPTNVKLSAFATGAMIGGFAGAFFATRLNFISPESFTFTESALILAMVVLGGRGSQLGVAIAAILIVTFPEFARPLADYRMLIFGAAMVTIMVVRPRGLVTHRQPSFLLANAASAGNPSE